MIIKLKFVFLILIVISAFSCFRIRQKPEQISNKIKEKSIDNTSTFFLDTINNRKVYFVVDKAPDCSMDMSSLGRYILDNNLLPTMDTICWFDRVNLSFVVEPNASISNIIVETRGSGFCYDSASYDKKITFMEESLNQSLTKLHWTPGVLKGEKVPVLLRIPIRIHISFD